MKELNRRIASFALAGAITAGVPTTMAFAEDTKEPTVIEETQEETEKEYTVKEKDTLAKISLKYYGNSEYWPLLAEYNHLEDPNVIFVGQKIKIPTDLLTLLEYDENYTEYEADKTYTVKQGDTMYCIVRTQYGLNNQETVDKLATYNDMSDPNKIYVGQVLLIPVIDKLQNVVAYDYTEEYNRMGWKLNHPRFDFHFDPHKPWGPNPPAPAPAPEHGPKHGPEHGPGHGPHHTLVLKP